MSARDRVLSRVRGALGREAARPPGGIVPARLTASAVDLGARIAMFQAALEKLAGKVHVASSEGDAGEYVRAVIGGGTAVISDAPLLRRCGFAPFAGEPSSVDVGVTGAAYGLADTGSLVMLASEEPRMNSLLPPVHVAVLARERLLSGLDELLTTLPRPADGTSSMVLITGPSRTADIEQILVRGVHGPGDLHVVIV